ncbi:GDSL-like Lipase/Acylhydrolase superfamily protein, partial [Striga asiatica]
EYNSFFGVDCADRLNKSLILMGEIGGNDINYPLAQGKSLEEIKTYVPFIIQAIANATREIIIAGASQIVISGNFPFGCFPYTLSAFSSNDSTDYDENGCIKRLNDLAIYQNSNLQTAIYSLRREFPNVVILYADYYNAFLTILRQAPILGFDRRTLLSPCCQSRDYNPTSPQFCGGIGVPVCDNPNQYVHWDGLHLTEEAHRQVSKIIDTNLVLGANCTF